MKLKHITSDSFSLFSNSKISEELINEYQKLVLGSINEISIASAKANKFDIDVIQYKINLLQSYRLSANIFAFNFELIQALKVNRDINKVIELLQLFEREKLSTYYSGNLMIGNLDLTSWTIDFSKETSNRASEVEGDGSAYMVPINDRRLSKESEIIYQVLSFIKNSKCNELSYELYHYLSHIILFDGKGITGGSSTRNVGAIYIRVPLQKKEKESSKLESLPDFIYYLEQIIHETAHLHLDMLMEFDGLILNDVEETYESPIRIDLRPMRGVFHATYVLARLLYVFNTIKFHDIEFDEIRINRLKVIFELLGVGINSIKRDAKLSFYGKKILKEMENTYDSIN